MQRKVNLTQWFVYEWGKPPRQKPHQVILRSPLSRIHYYHNKWLQVKEFRYLLPTYSWTLTLIHNCTSSVVTMSPFQCTAPNTWQTNRCTDPNTRLTPLHKSKYVTNTPTWEGYWLQSSLVHQHDEDHEVP